VLTKTETTFAGGCFFASIALVIAVIAGWVEHLIICFTIGKWGFLIAGAIFFPIGVVHGWGHWFGWW
jgi:hypothetical protein